MCVQMQEDCEATPAQIDGVHMGHMRLGRAGATAVAGEVSACGAAVAVRPADLADPDAIPWLFDEIETRLGTPETEKQLLPTIPLRRLGTPADIADAILLLASEHNRWMTGQVIQVAGGHAL